MEKHQITKNELTLEKARRIHKRIIGSEPEKNMSISQIASRIGSFRQKQIEEKERPLQNGEINDAEAVINLLDRLPFTFRTPIITRKKTLGIYCDFLEELNALCVKYISIINNLK